MMDFPWEDIVKIISASIAGALLGIEREQRNKPAGFRTLIMITVGSTVFAILSTVLKSDSPDRIASNIVTGVGFVGAGVIFKEGLNVKGVTTAATIWVAAAVGMAFGFGEYWVAIITLVLVLITLRVLTGLEKKFEPKEYIKTFKIGFNRNSYSLDKLEKELQDLGVSFTRTKISRHEIEIFGTYQFHIPPERSADLYSFLMNNPHVKTIDS
jgi:putative Mg2+ transporter-C (MgtC) family protein